MIKLFLVLFLISYSAYASVVARVDTSNIELGDMVTYSLNISGEDIKRPNIRRLCDTDVISTSSQTSINMINGNFSKNYILSYKFIPQKSCKIAAIKVEVGGKTELSNEVNIKVGPVTGAKDKDFVLKLSSDKSGLFVGETFNVTLLFKQKENAQAVDSEFIAPKLKGFWVKGKTKPKRYQKDGYIYSKIIYTLAAQREGILNIQRAQMRIASRGHTQDMWGSWIPKIKWKTYFSNELSIKVNPLPSGVNLVGNFKIDVNIDKREINTNEAVNVTVKVVGNGNLEDVKSFKPNIDSVNVFDEKIKINGTTLTQKMAFIADNNFVIPSFSLRYYDLNSKTIKTIKTKVIKIKVKNANPKEKLIIKREDKSDIYDQNVSIQNSQNSISNGIVFLVFILGLIIGASIVYFKPWKLLKRSKKESFLKDEKLILIKLLPYKDDKDDKDVEKIIDILEHNIYSKEKRKLDKSILKEIIKRHNIV